MPDNQERIDPKALRQELDSKADQMWRNLTEDVNPTFGLAFHLENSIDSKKNKRYGKEDKEVFDQFIYQPALKSEKGGAGPKGGA